jgi:serine/threonine-protein kinase
MRALGFVLGSATLLLGAPHAFAQDTTAAAVLAYDEAEALMAQGKVREACPRYAESHRLDPQLGTLLHLAECLEKNGQTATAWGRYREAAELAEKRGDARQELAKQRATALAPRLSKLLVNVAPGTDPTVSRDSMVIGKALWGTAVPTDPGQHNITATGPGLRAWSATIEVKPDGSTTTVNVPALQPEAQAPVGPVAVAAQPAPAAAAPPPAADQASSNGSGRWPALLVGGAGLVGIGIGTYFGVHSMSLKDDASSHCNGNLCDQEGVNLKEDAITAGNVSTAAFIIGSAALAGGVVMWVALAPDDSSSKASTPRGLRLGLGRGVTLEQRW